jgi:uncharacterized protein
MRIGIISDTHNLLRAEVFERFAGVEHILHAGDVGSPDILHELGSIAPVTAVWGNTDGWELRERAPEVAHVTLAGASIVVLHGMQLGSPTPRLAAGAYPDADLVVFGHSHRPVIQRVGRVLAINPGSAGRQRFSDPVTLAVAEVDGPDRIEAHLVELDPSRK